jgi:hypothetical protein
MNAKIILCIAMGVFVAHLAVFMIIFRLHMDAHPPVPPPPPNFRVAEEHVIDPATGEKLLHREISVSTKLAPGVYQGRTEEPAVK